MLGTKQLEEKDLTANKAGLWNSVVTGAENRFNLF